MPLFLNSSLVNFNSYPVERRASFSSTRTLAVRTPITVQVDAEPASRRNNNARAVLLRRSPPQHSGWLEHHHNNNKPVSGRQQGKYEADRKRDTSVGAGGGELTGPSTALVVLCH